MSAYNVVSRAAMVAGQPEDISVVLANFDAIAAIVNGLLDNSNLAAGANIDLTKLASAGQIGASGVTIGASQITLGGDVVMSRSAADTLTIADHVVISGQSAGADRTLLVNRYSGSGAGSPAIRLQYGVEVNDRWRVLTNGTLQWSDGVLAPDTSLSRGAANRLDLATDDALRLTASTSSSTNLLEIIVAGDTSTRMRLTPNGQIFWGPGNATHDVALGRAAAGTLDAQDGSGVAANSQFRAGSFRILSTSGADGIRYDSAAAVANIFLASRVTGDTFSRFSARVSGELLWGTGALAQDTGLKRSAAGELQITDAGAGRGGFDAKYLTLSSSAGFNAINLIHTGASEIFLRAQVSGDAFARFTTRTSGELVWGDGTAAGDFTLVRSGTDLIFTGTAARTFRWQIGGNEHMRVTAAGGSQTAIMLRYDSPTTGVQLQQVTIGAVDSGGAGFRVLRVPN